MSFYALSNMTSFKKENIFFRWQVNNGWVDMPSLEDGQF